MTDLHQPSYEAGLAAPSGDPAAAFKQMQELLKAKDDTSRFVGLALLKSVLDNQPGLRGDAKNILNLWESIPPKFLDRLLRARQNKNATKQEANDMVDIAVAVLHTFTILLSEESRNEKRLVGRTAALTNALIQSSEDSTILILQTLLTFSSQKNGASEILNLEDISPIIEIATQQQLVLQILSLAWSNVATDPLLISSVRENIEKAMPALVVSFKQTDAVTLLDFVGTTFNKLPNEAIPLSPPWIQTLCVILRNLVVNRSTAAGRAAYTGAAAALLQSYPTAVSSILFQDAKSDPKSEAKPFSYLFVNLLLIDIRSSFPSLLSKLNSSEYPAISKRLAAAFDVISSFIGFLITSLDNEETPNSKITLNMPPDLLLKLRKDIAETISLTIEYLRDRWDAAIAGTSGLHPSARVGTSATSEGTRLTLAWDSMENNVGEDPLILSSIRTMAIWLREDENENLRNESAGLADMFIELYKSSSASTSDFRHPILTAFEGIMTTEDGVDGFLAQNGWDVVTEDLISIIDSGSSQTKEGHSQECVRGIEAIRVLLAVLDHDSTTEPREDWMKMVNRAASQRVRPSSGPLYVELQIAMLQLATALLTSAPLGMQKRYAKNISGIIGLVNQLKPKVEQFPDQTKDEFEESLEDIIMSLDDLR